MDCWLKRVICASSCLPLFPVNPPQLICSTKDQHPQTYWGNQGDAKWLLKQNKNDLHGLMLASNDTKDAQRGATAIPVLFD